jgi:hypothetical protein
MTAPSAHKSRAPWLLAPILLLGLWLRLPGTFYQVPLHFDEGIYVQNVLCGFPPTGTYYHPFLGRYLLSVPEALPCAKALFEHAPHPARATRAAFLNDPAPFLALGRSVTLLLGLVSVALCYALGRSLGGTAVGLGAALLMAVAPGSVTVANNLGHWSLAGCLSLAFFLLAQRALALPRSRPRLLALGVAYGLAVAVVYTNALLGLPLLWVLWQRWQLQTATGAAPDPIRDVIAVALAAAVAHVAGNFTGVLHPASILHDILTPEASALSGDPTRPTYLTNMGWHVHALFDRFGLSAPVAILGAAGLAWTSWRIGGLWRAMLLFALALLFLQPVLVVFFAIRYVTPIAGLTVIAAAWVLVQLGRALMQRARGASSLSEAGSWPAAALLVLASIPCLATDLAYHRALALTPSRLQARTWIEANLPSGSTIVQSVEFMGPALNDCEALAEIPGREHEQPCYHVRIAPVDAEHFEREFVEYLHASGADYAIYTAATPPGTLKRMGRTVTVSGALQQAFPLLASFTQPGLEAFHDDTATVNAPIEIYALKAP